MARGQAQAAGNQLATTNAAASGYGANAAGMLGPLSTQAQSLINSPGFDPQTLAAITNAGMGGVNAAGDAAKGQVARTVARTGNPAGVGGLQDAIARTQGQIGGQEAGDIQIQNAQFQAQQRKQGLDLLNSMYGTNVGAETSLYGLGPGTLQARAAGPGWAQGFKDVMQGISGAGGGGGGGAPAQG